MNKGLFLILACILLFPALFVIVNPVYDDVDSIHEREGMNYYNVFDASQMGVPLERPMSQSLMDYSPTHYNWFDITNEYTSFPTLGDLKGTGSSSVDTGEIPLVPLDASIRADDIYAMFSVDNQLAKSTHILYHDGRDIYSATVSNSLYENTLEYGIDSVLATPNPALLVFSIWRMEGESEDADLYFPSARPDFKDVHFSHDTKSVRYYRNVLNEQLATFYVWLPSISGGDKLTIEYGESLPDSVADRSISIPSPVLAKLGLDFWDTTDTANWHPYSEFPAVPEPPAPYVYDNPTLGRNIIVDALGGGDYTTLADAVANASDGDVLEIVGTQTLDGYFEINKNIAISGGNINTTSGISSTSNVKIKFSTNISSTSISFMLYPQNGVYFIESGIYDCPSGRPMVARSGGQIVINGGEISGTYLECWYNGKMWINSGQFNLSTRFLDVRTGLSHAYISGGHNIGNGNIRIQTTGNTVHLSGLTSDNVHNLNIADGGKVYAYPSVASNIGTITGTGTVYVAIPPTAPSTAPPLPPLPARYNYDGETYILRADGKGDFTTLADAVGMASDGDIIVVEGEVEVPSSVFISKSLKFTGTGTLVSNVTYMLKINGGVSEIDCNINSGSHSLTQEGGVLHVVGGIWYSQSDYTLVQQGGICVVHDLTTNRGLSPYSGNSIMWVLGGTYTDTIIHRFGSSDNPTLIMAGMTEGSKIIESTRNDWAKTIHVLPGARNDLDFRLYGSDSKLYIHDGADSSNYVYTTMGGEVVHVSPYPPAVTFQATPEGVKEQYLAFDKATYPYVYYFVDGMLYRADEPSPYVINSAEEWRIGGGAFTVEHIVTSPKALSSADRAQLQAELTSVPKNAEGTAEVKPGSEFSFHIIENRKLEAYHPDTVALYYGYPMDVEGIENLRSDEQLQTVLWNDGAFRGYRAGVLELEAELSLTEFNPERGFALCGYSTGEGNQLTLLAGAPSTSNDLRARQFFLSSGSVAEGAELSAWLSSEVVSGVGKDIALLYVDDGRAKLQLSAIADALGSTSYDVRDFLHGDEYQSSVGVDDKVMRLDQGWFLLYGEDEYVYTDGRRFTYVSSDDMGSSPLPAPPAPYSYTNPTLGRNIRVGAGYDYPTYYDANLAAQDGDVIELMEDIDFGAGRTWTVEKSLKIISDGKRVTAGWVRAYDGDIMFENITFVGPNVTISPIANTNLTMTDCVMEGSTGILVQPNKGKVHNMILTNCSGDVTAGGYTFIHSHRSGILTASKSGDGSALVIYDNPPDKIEIQDGTLHILGGDGNYDVQFIYPHEPDWGEVYVHPGAGVPNIIDGGKVYQISIPLPSTSPATTLYTTTGWIDWINDGRASYISFDGAYDDGIISHPLLDTVLPYSFRFTYFEEDNLLASTPEGVLIRASRLPHADIEDFEDDFSLVFESNYRYLSVEYGGVRFFNFGHALTVFDAGGMHTYPSTVPIQLNTLRIVREGTEDTPAGFYVNNFMHIPAEFSELDTLHISCVAPFDYTIYDSSVHEYFETSYFKLSGDLDSTATFSFSEREFARLSFVVADFADGQFWVEFGDDVLTVRKNGLNYRFIVDGREIMIRTTSGAFYVDLVRDYEQWTLIAMPVRLIGAEAEAVGRPSSVSWIDTRSVPIDHVTLAYSRAEAKVYGLTVMTASTAMHLPERILTDESNQLVGDGLRMAISYWDVGTVMEIGEWELTRIDERTLSVLNTRTEEGGLAPYADELKVMWTADGFSVNGAQIAELSTVPESMTVDGYLRFAGATSVDVTVTTEKELQLGELNFDVMEYAAYVLVLSLMAGALAIFLASRMGYGFMDYIEFYGALAFIIFGAVAVLIGGM